MAPQEGIIHLHDAGCQGWFTPQKDSQLPLTPTMHCKAKGCAKESVIKCSHL